MQDDIGSALILCEELRQEMKALKASAQTVVLIPCRF